MYGQTPVRSADRLMQKGLDRAPVQAMVYEDVDEMPEFPGGDDSLFVYLRNNIKYPEECVKKNKQGTVIVSFIIDDQGQVCGVRASKKVNDLLDAEAKRVVSGMPAWKPGRKDGRLVSTSYSLPVTFQIPKKAKKK